MVKTYYKLVRDKIPRIIEASGSSCRTEALDLHAYLDMLDKKLVEELAEYQESKSIEELADLLEVMMAVVKARGYDWQQVEQTRLIKREERGGFDKRILLCEVVED